MERFEAYYLDFGIWETYLLSQRGVLVDALFHSCDDSLLNMDFEESELYSRLTQLAGSLYDEPIDRAINMFKSEVNRCAYANRGKWFDEMGVPKSPE